jgi:hypothetical protein
MMVATTVKGGPMKPHLISAILVAATTGCGAQSDGRLAVQEQSSALSAAVSRPASVPADYVLTLNGFFNPLCVIKVHNGEAINGDGNIVQTDGTIRKVKPCPYGHFDREGNVVTGPAPWPQPGDVPHQTGQWWAWFINYGASNITWVSSDYWVPAKPASHDGQDIAFWTGVQDSSGSEVIQPVLDKGEYYDSWAVRGENCCLGNNDYTSAYYPVNVGDHISGYAYPVTNRDCPGWSGEWFIGINVNGGSTVNFYTCQWYAPMTETAGGVLEIYHVVHCSDLPQQPNLGFYDVTAYDNGYPINFTSWYLGTTQINPGCNPGVSAWGSSGTVSWKYY